MKISVCIPAYNRAKLLPYLLDSVLNQEFSDFNLILCEDNSPERPEINAVVTRYLRKFPGKILYYENDTNLGYDGNLRRLIELATGEYVLFMGNDDLMAENALARVNRAVTRYPNVGVILRSYSSFLNDPDEKLQIFRYFNEERFFDHGAETIVTFFRRSVFISGMVVHRDTAFLYATNQFDGTLLYQQHIVGRILSNRNGVYLPEILSHHRLGGTPDFGNSATEQGKFVPRAQTPASSLNFMRGMLLIARNLDKDLNLSLYEPILRDIGNYSYPVLSIQRGTSPRVFTRYSWELAKLGLWKVPLYYVYFFSLLLLGKARCDSVIAYIKKRLGRAPLFGNIYTGVE